MKKMYPFMVMSLLLLLQLQAKAQTNPNLFNEPKSVFKVNINGKEYQVREGEELKINETLDHPTLKVEEASTKIFDNKIVSFNFPSFYSFEYETEVGFKSWTLNGKSTVFMMFEMAEKVDRDDFAGRFVDKFGKKNCKTSPLDMKLGEKKLKGTKIDVEMIGQKLSVYFVEIPMADKRSAFFYIQDVINDEQITKECQQFIETMDSSIQYRE